jgi:hypothetical protein
MIYPMQEQRGESYATLLPFAARSMSAYDRHQHQVG